MEIIISPAKKMRTAHDFLAPGALPAFLEQTETLLAYLRALPPDALRQLLRCNEKIATESYAQYQRMDLRRGLSPAILAFDGIQYRYMAPQVFETGAFAYAEAHLRILSGFYGVLRPFDGVAPYRLEMQARVRVDGHDSLYSFWGGRLGAALCPEDGVLLNLASAEYSKAVAQHLPAGTRMVGCVFGALEGGRVREKGVHVKMARGEMVRFLAEHGITDVRDARGFDRLGYAYCAAQSDGRRYVFLKQPG